MSLMRCSLISPQVINSSTALKSSNPSSLFATTNRKPALGPSFTFLTDATLWLTRPPAPEPGDPSITSHDAANQGEIDEKSAGDLRVAGVLRSRISVRLVFPLFVYHSKTSILMHSIRAAIENIVCIPNSRWDHQACLIISRFDDLSHGHVLFGVRGAEPPLHKRVLQTSSSLQSLQLGQQHRKRLFKIASVHDECLVFGCCASCCGRMRFVHTNAMVSSSSMSQGFNAAPIRILRHLLRRLTDDT